MSAGFAQDHQLYEQLCTAIGAESAERLMTRLLPDHIGQLATKDDLHALATELRSEIAELRAELRGGMGELRGEMGELRGEFKADLARQSRQHLIATVTTMLATATLAFAAAATLG